MNIRRGFTLIEVMVVVGIIGVLASVLYINFNETRTLNRDLERQADLRLLQVALDLYKQQHGRYPEGCNTTAATAGWSGERDTISPCSDGRGDYIRGTVDRPFAPNFIRTLPTDPRPQNGGGYLYKTNLAGETYKLIAWRTVEQDTWLGNNDIVYPSDPDNYTGAVTNRRFLHPFKSCDESADGGVCRMMSPGNGGSAMPYCAHTHPTYQTTYAVWGGRATEPESGLRAEEQTERIWCDDPGDAPVWN